MTARLTIAQVNARVDALVAAQETTNQLLARLVAQADAFATPAAVVEITTAKSAKTRTRNTAPKSTPAKTTTTKTVKDVVALDVAQQRVDAGENAWKIFVASSTTGEPIPYGKVQRAIKAQERANTPKAAKPQAKPTKAVKALGTPASVYFAMSKSQLLADGSNGAQAELARRAAKKAAKSA